MCLFLEALLTVSIQGISIKSNDNTVWIGLYYINVNMVYREETQGYLITTKVQSLTLSTPNCRCPEH